MNRRVQRADGPEGLCTLTLDRPDKLNALDTAAFEELDAHLADLEGESDRIGCVILRGSGHAFCAGADLAAIGTTPIDPGFKPGVVTRLSALPQPIIAAVHGICMTGGLELALACDFIVADSTARFADTHGKWGLVGAWGMGQRLSRRIGVASAKRMMMTSRTVDAQEARNIGLVDLLAPSNELDRAAEELAGEILPNSWHTNFAAKRFLRATSGMSLDEALAYEHENYPGFAPDYQERVAKFTRK